MSNCPRCKHHNSVRIIEWPLSQDGTPTHLEIQGFCIMCGYESRRFCVPVSYSNREVDQVLAYMAMTHEQQEAEEIELPPCRCGQKPTIIEINTALQGGADYWWAIECPACFRKTLWKRSKKEARYEWQVLTLAGVVLHPERVTKIEQLETLVSLLREQVVCLEEQLDLRNYWINKQRSCTKSEEKNG